MENRKIDRAIGGKRKRKSEKKTWAYISMQRGLTLDLGDGA